MKEKLVTIGTLTCLVVLTCLLLVHALVIFPGLQAIHWFFVRSAAVLGRMDAPAWVQAVGSVVAIVAAIGIALWQRVSDRRESNEKAHLSGTVVVNGILEMMGPLIILLDKVATGCSGPGAMKMITDPGLKTRLDSQSIPTESQLLVLAHALPEAANYLAQGCTVKIQLSMVLGAIAEDLAAGRAFHGLPQVQVVSSLSRHGAFAFREAAKLLKAYVGERSERFEKKLFREDEIDKAAFLTVRRRR